MTGMPAETWTALTSLGGVALGGGLSWLVQSTTQRTNVRNEQRKLELARAETRRTERLAALERFVAAASEAERQALSRPRDQGAWDAWEAVTQPIMDRVWVAERMIRVLFPVPVHDAARAYFLVLNQGVWEGAEEYGTVRDSLEEPRLAFLDLAGEALEKS